MKGHATDGREVGEGAEVVAVAGVDAQLGGQPHGVGALRALGPAGDAGVVEGAGLGAGPGDRRGHRVEDGGQVACMMLV